MGLGTCGTWAMIELRFTLPSTTMGVSVILNDLIYCNGSSSNTEQLSKKFCAKEMLKLKQNICLGALNAHPDIY